MHPLDGSRLKIQRAEKHLQTLNKRIDTFFGSDFYHLVAEAEPNTRDGVVRIQFDADIPPDWGVICGEILYQLRSALDHAYFALCKLHRRNPGKVYFPIFAKKPERGLSIPTYLTEKQRTLVEEAQPYNWATSDGEITSLWLLHLINRFEKHRALPVILTIGHVRQIAFTGNEDVTIGIYGVRPPSVIENGAVVISFFVIPLKPGLFHGEVDMNAQFEFDIQFEETEDIPGRIWIRSFLGNTITDVRHTIELLSDEFVSH